MKFAKFSEEISKAEDLWEEMSFYDEDFDAFWDFITSDYKMIKNLEKKIEPLNRLTFNRSKYSLEDLVYNLRMSIIISDFGDSFWKLFLDRNVSKKRIKLLFQKYKTFKSFYPDEKLSKDSLWGKAADIIQYNHTQIKIMEGRANYTEIIFHIENTDGFLEKRKKDILRLIDKKWSEEEEKELKYIFDSAFSPLKSSFDDIESSNLERSEIISEYKKALLSSAKKLRENIIKYEKVESNSKMGSLKKIGYVLLMTLRAEAGVLGLESEDPHSPLNF